MHVIKKLEKPLKTCRNNEEKHESEGGITLVFVVHHYINNNNIGADFDWFNPHLYHVPQKVEKKIQHTRFLHHINVRKRLYIIPLLCEHKISTFT